MPNEDDGPMPPILPATTPFTPTAMHLNLGLDGPAVQEVFRKTLEAVPDGKSFAIIGAVDGTGYRLSTAYRVDKNLWSCEAEAYFEGHPGTGSHNEWGLQVKASF